MGQRGPSWLWAKEEASPLGEATQEVSKGAGEGQTLPLCRWAWEPGHLLTGYRAASVGISTL